MDQASSAATPIIASELNEDVYGLRQVAFQPGDLVLDIGAHVGMFSLICGRFFPFVQVVALEPFPQNVQCFKENMRRNGVTNVQLLEMGVSGDGQAVTLSMDPTNTGGTSAWSGPQRQGMSVEVPTITLDDLFHQLGEPEIRFLKMDCEGMEYPSLYNFHFLQHVRNIGLEAHTNSVLRAKGYSIYKLKKLLQAQLGADHVWMMSAELKDHLVELPHQDATSAE